MSPSQQTKPRSSSTIRTIDLRSGSGTLRGTLHALSRRLPARVVRDCFPKARAGRAKLVVLGFDCNGVGIATNDAPAHDQFQRHDAIEQVRPVHRQLDRAGSRQTSIGFKKDAASADVDSSAESVLFGSLFVRQLVVELQRDRIPAVSPVLGSRWRLGHGGALQVGSGGHTPSFLYQGIYRTSTAIVNEHLP